MFSQNIDGIFAIARESHSCPRTPTLPALQESPKEKVYSFRNRNLKILTSKSKNLSNYGHKSNNSQNRAYNNVALRKSLLSEFEKFSEPKSSLLPQACNHEVYSKESNRSLSSSLNDKGKHYLHEISSLNNKIRNLIKEQDNLRDKLLIQENIIMSLQKESSIKPVVACHEIQSATIPLHQSYDENDFSVTFKPQGKWVQRSRRFPREVFCKISKAKFN
ncbi:hypothetical protein SteCoe_24303 [Stentor coeruleus]|uniref:Uncharacterized protein n=1 Tax=Stentor coeruleus TaxID=5963 RepID=A0A1R2BI01_9CILI|nr:hypothetical protein SteCoe_24303 [Stentor coeruleus]